MDKERQQVEMQKVCENKAVLQTDDYIVAMKMTNVDDSGKLQDRQ
jgi:hypothetical protein